MAYTDQELLAIVGDEKKRSVGFDVNSELLADRERALNYIKGDMSDVPSLPNRSNAVSTVTADTIETWLSDMVEVLAGGEDVVTFSPTGAEDEAAAKQETDYINHVFFNENGGFMVLYTMLKDAGQVKTGVVTWWDEEIAAPEPKAYAGLTEAELGLIETQDNGRYEVCNIRPSEEQGPVVPDPQTGQPSAAPLFDVDLIAKPRKRARVAAVPPADFTVAADTVKLPESTYCAMRSRPRAQDLIADGVDPDVVDRLPAYSANNDVEQQARDTAGEHLSGSSNGGIGDLRQVEVIKHFIRLVQPPENVAKIWKIRTSNDDAILIDKEEVDEMPFAAITPFPVTHRFYGESLADKTMDQQKIGTSLTRMALDSGYFALNQRSEVSEDQSSENTLPDLLRNEPGMPVRSKTGNAVRGIQAGSLGFDPFNAMEYFATVVEARTGVVRNAQGLNPDTLHETAGGAAMLASAAQKRTRLMARLFAETGIKDMYLGLHALLRRIGGVTDTIRLRGEWQNVDPTAWGQRNDMSVEIGVGSSGKAQDLAAMSAVIDKQIQAVTMQGGPHGPLVNLENLYASAIRFTGKTGIKDPEVYWSDPKTAQQPQGAPQPDPHAIAAQAAVEAAQAKLALDQQKLALDQQKAAAGSQADQAKLALDQRKVELDEARLELAASESLHARELAETKLATDTQLARDKLDSDNALKLATINAQFKTSVTVAQIRSEAEQFRASADVAIQAADHAHDHALADQAHVHGLETAVADRVLSAASEPPAASEPEAEAPAVDEPPSEAS